MRKLTILVVPLIAALTAQAATAASERHHARTKDRAVVSEQIRNSNAYYAAPGYTADRSFLRSEDDGAMASGVAGH